MAELADLARQVNGQLDTRMARLEILLRQADETLARLDAVEGKLTDDKSQKSDNSGKHPPQNASSDWQPPRNPLLNSPLHREVISLAEAGEKAIDIAHKLGRPIGEIELILSLHGKNKNSSKN
ncbi:MAG: hypothetical protein JW709_00615 [Sedimentisphaerales bacterium]|nr:hypothetical protein [Sedimentisphaerales bacterium]